MNASFAEQSRPADSRVVLCRGNCGFHGGRRFSRRLVLRRALESPWRELLKASACEERANELELEGGKKKP